jgi:hypothetical protein
MGAWGYHFDECDGALDFLGDAADSRDWGLVRDQLEHFIEAGGYEDGEEAWAAAELVAAALGQPSSRLDPELRDWAAEHGPQAEAIRGKANEAVELLRQQSELSELWAESDEGQEWQTAVAELQSRLKA